MKKFESAKSSIDDVSMDNHSVAYVIANLQDVERGKIEKIWKSNCINTYELLDLIH